MMEVEAPYLQAIQEIAGTTPGEKLKTINLIARQLAEISAGHLQSTNANVPVPDVPEPLKPLVRVEVAKILHQYDAIIEALKSEDLVILSRALQAKWFFDGSDSSVVNARYFLDNVFPEISLLARSKIVKNLGVRLRNTKVAADFFLTISELYGVDQAVPLLSACDEVFAFDMIIAKQIVLGLKTVKQLYRKYPNLVIKYLMLSKRNDDVRNLHQIDIRDYENFLPEIANKRFNDFMEIYKMHRDFLRIKLGRKASDIFIKTQPDLLVDNPDQYLELVSLEIVTQKLSSDDFTKMFKNCFPKQKNDFNYETLNEILKYYKPAKKRLTLILNSFREVYGTDLLRCQDLVDVDLIKVLPSADRVNQARLKLESDKDWHLYDTKRSWRCYLPIGESIPLITKEIAKTSDSGNRGQLLYQLAYTSKVNDDKAAFLQILTYMYNRHRNEQEYIVYGFLDKCTHYFELAMLSEAHWEILNKFIKYSEVQNHLFQQEVAITALLEAGLHYCVLNSLPFDDYLRILVEIKMNICNSSWNVLKKFPNLEKKFLDLMIEVIPKQYPFDNKIWIDGDTQIISGLANSIWDFNSRNRVSNGKLKKLSIKDYPWLYDKIKSFVTEKDDDTYSQEQFLEKIRKQEPDLYKPWIQDLHNFWDYGVEIIFHVLKQDSQRIRDNWKECLNKIQNNIRIEYYPVLFIKKSQWYQQLPIEFFKESLKTYTDPETCTGSIVTLALLLDGETYTKIIEPYIPKDATMDIEDTDAKTTYDILLAIASNLRKVNPPVSLDIIKKFCVGDYLQMGLRSLTSVSRGVPIAKVIPFARKLTNSRVSVMKHGIRLMYLVAPLEDIYNFLSDLWSTEGHTSIRGVIFTKVNDLFCKLPDSRSWKIMRRCLSTLNLNDDQEIFRGLTILLKIPNEYIHEYIESVLSVLDSMKQQSDDPKKFVNYSCKLIRNIDGSITRILSEEYCQDLIRRYLFDFDYDSDIFEAGKYLTIDSYLLASTRYNEVRFKFVGDVFQNSVKSYWDQSHPKNFKFYPMNFMVKRFIADFDNQTDRRYDVQMFESLLEVFQSVLQPHQNALSYLGLVYAIEYHRAETWKDFGANLAEKVPNLIEIFSPECIILIANSLKSFVQGREINESEDAEEKKQDIIEAFTNSGAIHCAFIAAKMLFNNKSKQLNERHKAVVRALRNFHHPGILLILNEFLADIDFSHNNTN